MKGSGSATAAVTFLNALFTGIGCAAGIELRASASVELVPADRRSFSINPAADSPLVHAIAGAALDLWAPGERFEVRATLDSEIPVARGLKSSSAVSGALASAIAAALGRPTRPDEVARLSAAVSRAIGVSATGAFDDALAGLRPGIQVTDNVARRALRSDAPDPGWHALVLVPGAIHRPAPEYLESFRALAPEALAAETEARLGHALAAMELNTALVERALGVDLSGLHRRLRGAGALGSGVSGLGPSVVAIVPAERRGDARSVLAEEEGDLLDVTFTKEPNADREEGA